MEYHEKLRNTRQDSESDSGNILGKYTFKFTVVDGSVTSEWFIIKSGVKWVPDVGILIFTLLGLGREEGNSKQEKRNKVKFQNSAGGP